MNDTKYISSRIDPETYKELKIQLVKDDEKLNVYLVNLIKSDLEKKKGK